MALFCTVFGPMIALYIVRKRGSKLCSPLLQASRSPNAVSVQCIQTVSKVILIATEPSRLRDGACGGRISRAFYSLAPKLTSGSANIFLMTRLCAPRLRSSFTPSTLRAPYAFRFQCGHWNSLPTYSTAVVFKPQ